MNETVLDFGAAQKMYTSGENSVPITFQSMATSLGNAAETNALDIFKVLALTVQCTPIFHTLLMTKCSDQ